MKNEINISSTQINMFAKDLLQAFRDSDYKDLKPSREKNTEEPPRKEGGEYHAFIKY